MNPPRPSETASVSSEIGDLLSKKHSNQSPIDLSAPSLTDVRKLEICYDGLEVELVNSNRVLRVDVIPDDTVVFDGREYTLDQFHFHSPSEHTVEGRRFDMEVHLVHRSGAGEILVIGVFFTIGLDNPFLRQFWDKIPRENNGRLVLSEEVQMAPLLQIDEGYYCYTGSLTTPPYTPGVRWLVLKKVQQLSPEQYAHYRSIFPENTYREIQPRWDREIVLVR